MVTYNGLRWLDRCFQSLLESSFQVSVIAVDNASMDASADHINDNYPDIHLIRAKENLGFGQANNLGIKHALKKGADYVFLLNQDAQVEPETIEKLVNIQKTNTEYAILSPVHLNGEGDKLDGGFQNYAGPEYTANLLNDLLLNKTSTVYETRFVNAAAWLLSKECLEKVGGFDPLFFHYGEDVNYCQRVQYHKLKIGIVPTARICHDRKYAVETYGQEQIFRHFLLKVADINNEQYLKDNIKLRQQDVIRMLMGFIRGDVERIRQNRLNLRRKRRVMHKIETSRQQNSKGGMLYL